MLFIGPGVRSWGARNERGIHWVSSPPLSGRPGYPVLLDLVEAARRAAPPEAGALFETAANALAPGWEHLVSMGLEPDRPRSPNARELGASDEAPIVQRFLACGMAQVLARLPDGYGILVRSSEAWDLTSLEFLDRLIRETEGRVPIAIETARLPPRSPLIAGWTAIATPVRGAPRAHRGPPEPGELILSVCPHGLPVATLHRLGGDVPDAAERFSWPDGQAAVGLSASRARAARKGLSPEAQKSLHAAIFDAHPCEGWNYLRRMSHAIASADADRLLRQHTACVAGMMQIGYDFLYRHLAAIALALPPGEAVGAHLGAARLAPRLSGKGGRLRAVFHYGRALRQLRSGEETLPVMHELANLYASWRTPQTLRRSRRWYGAAWKLLPAIADPVERINAEIRLCNGLALVEYHERDGDAALALERRALQLIADADALDVGNRAARDRIARWAEPLIRTNTAKLLIKRFDDVDGGIALLQKLLTHPEKRVQLNCEQNLGRVCFDKGDYAGAIDYLGPRSESQGQADLSETEELYDRLVFTLSLAALEQWPRAAFQLPRLRYLAKMNDAGKVVDIVNLLAAVCAGDQSRHTARTA